MSYYSLLSLIVNMTQLLTYRFEVSLNQKILECKCCQFLSDTKQQMILHCRQKHSTIVWTFVSVPKNVITITPF